MIGKEILPKGLDLPGNKGPDALKRLAEVFWIDRLQKLTDVIRGTAGQHLLNIGIERRGLIQIKLDPLFQKPKKPRAGIDFHTGSIADPRAGRQNKVNPGVKWAKVKCRPGT